MLVFFVEAPHDGVAGRTRLTDDGVIDEPRLLRVDPGPDIDAALGMNAVPADRVG